MKLIMENWRSFLKEEKREKLHRLASTRAPGAHNMPVYPAVHWELVRKLNPEQIKEALSHKIFSLYKSSGSKIPASVWPKTKKRRPYQRVASAADQPAATVETPADSPLKKTYAFENNNSWPN